MSYLPIMPAPFPSHPSGMLREEGAGSMLDQYRGINRSKSKPAGKLPASFALTIASKTLIGPGPVMGSSLASV